MKCSINTLGSPQFLTIALSYLKLARNNIHFVRQFLLLKKYETFHSQIIFDFATYNFSEIESK